MTLTPQHKQILAIHQDNQWHCSTEIEFCRDQRKRISELNHAGYTFEAKPCNGICGKKHNARLFMRKLVSSVTPQNAPRPSFVMDRAFMTAAKKVAQILKEECCPSIKCGFTSHDPKCEQLKVINKQGQLNI